MNNEWVVVKHNYSEDGPNISIGLTLYHRGRLFRSSTKHFDYSNTFDGVSGPSDYGFFWSTHDFDREDFYDEIDEEA